MNGERFLKMLKFLKLALLIPFLFLLSVHFIIKDRSEFFANIFNVFPIPFLIGIGLVISILVHKHRKVFRFMFITTLLLIAHWFHAYYGFNNVPVSQENNHILLWNIDKSKFLPREELKRKIALFDPDFLVFLETRKLALTEVKYLKEQFPQYNFRTLQGYMMVASKGSIESTIFKRLESKTKCNILKTRIEGKSITLLVPDIIVTEGYRNGREDLKGILELALENDADIVSGDFNTPYESIHFEGFKKTYQSFHDVSEGFTATWPKGLPLLELDQIWVSRQLRPISLKKFYFKDYSNHDMLIGSFEFTD